MEKNRLWNNGWVGSITFGKLIKGTNTLVDTKACSFEVSFSTNRLELDSPLVFTVPADPTSLAYTIHLGYTDGTDKILFKKEYWGSGLPNIWNAHNKYVGYRCMIKDVLGSIESKMTVTVKGGVAKPHPNKPTEDKPKDKE